MREDAQVRERTRVGSAAKRGFDLVGASLLLVLLTPLLLLVALGIKLDSRGPVVYRSPRVGRNGRIFQMLKFRKMRDDAEGPLLTSLRDERLTRFGCFLVKTKLDEVPQLWNVIRGDMSLVGPRPEDRSFVILCPKHFEVVLRVRPGITGLSQLAFAAERHVLDVPNPVHTYVQRLLPQKIGLDQLYVASRSMRMDLHILAWTVLAVFLRVDVSVDRQDGRLTVRRRPAVPKPVLGSDLRATSEGTGA
jgi:lipopolysaccharide/colanic/teichoic acid biosynthesis glycosyltransferase